jgi:hypothetical protein
MKKTQSTITNLLVIPLIASAVFLASPAFAENTNNLPNQMTQNMVRHKTNKENLPNVRKGVAGVVSAINGTILIVTTKENIQYTVDTGHATIMKATEGQNPALVTISDIKIGDFIMVRGVIKDTEINADKIFDGKMLKMGEIHKTLGKHKHPKRN